MRTDANLPILCPREDALSRFLDNDLPSRDAADLLLHMRSCQSCQSVYVQMQQAQTALRLLPAPGAPYGGPDAARVRVMERVGRSVRVGGDTASAANTTFSPAQRRRGVPVWAGAAAAITAAACIVVSLQWNGAKQAIPTDRAALVPVVSLPEAAIAAVPVPTATPRVPLPSQNEMAFLYHLHDAARSASLSGADPTDRRDCAAEARAALLRDTERLADSGEL